MDVSSINPNLLEKFATLLLIQARKLRWPKWVWPQSPDILSIGDIVVKQNRDEHLGEAQAMRYLAEHTSVPVPKVYWAFIHRGRTYTVMSKVQGTGLHSGWQDRSQSSKDHILFQLKQALIQLRAIPLPAGMGVASITGGPIHDGLWYLGNCIQGPFEKVADFYKGLMGGNDLQKQWPEYSADLNVLAAFYRQAQYDLVFTHGDLNMSNIIVSSDDKITLIDWATAGWYPSFWEYTKAKNVNRLTPSWEAEIDNFMTPLPYELAMDRIRLRFFDWFGMHESELPAS